MLSMAERPPRGDDPPEAAADEARSRPAASLTPSAQKVQDALRALGFGYTVDESPHSARTSAEAAKRVGCEVGHIAKSLVFRTAQTGRPVLVIVSGANRVNEWRVGVLLKEVLEKASAAFVREATGYAIGGIPPVGHPRPIETFIDEDLLGYREIWAAAGTPNALFRLDPADLVKMTGGRVMRVT
jgi:prolyl-tRNA editing enzyme YbaK/EbsC (Cys-tRNA(Pro) deacylase)